MECEAVKLDKEGQKPGPRGGMATHELARKEMTEEVARVRGRKRRDPHLQALERAAGAWQGRKKGEEFRKRRKESKKAGASTEVGQIKDMKTEAKIEPQDSGIAGWLQQGLARWMEQNQPESKKAGASTEVRQIKDMKTEAKIEPQDSGIAGWLQQGLARWMEQNQPESKKDEGKKLNSATMAVLLRRAVAREKALALGRKLPNPHAIVLEQEAARWRESKEEERKVIEREIGMLQKLVQFMAGDGFFDGSKKDEEWGIGQVSCFVDKVPQDGWNLIVVALERSQFMRRWGWGDLLGVYHAGIDDQLRLTNYNRISPDEVEKYLKEREKDGSKRN